jgi:hypothetical protein
MVSSLPIIRPASSRRDEDERRTILLEDAREILRQVQPHEEEESHEENDVYHHLPVAKPFSPAVVLVLLLRWTLLFPIVSFFQCSISIRRSPSYST